MNTWYVIDTAERVPFRAKQRAIDAAAIHAHPSPVSSCRDPRI